MKKINVHSSLNYNHEKLFTTGDFEVKYVNGKTEEVCNCECKCMYDRHAETIIKAIRDSQKSSK